MSEKFIILRRTSAEMKIFGDDVYIDIDGKNIGILGNQDFLIDLETGKHTLKMYKSHTMLSFIGIAENEFDIVEGVPLFARYSAPLMVNQNGTIIIANYESKNQLDDLVAKIESQLNSDYQEDEQIRTKREKESKKSEGMLFVLVFLMSV